MSHLAHVACLLLLPALALPVAPLASEADLRARTQHIPSDRVHIFYYPWYGNPETDGRWLHWQENGHEPPEDLASNYYPALGPYSSNDPQVVAQHMRWIAEAGVGVVVVSWWGSHPANRRIDDAVPLILDAAAAEGLQVAFLLEPYGGRTPASVRDDLAYLYDRYGRHAAFFRVQQHTFPLSPSGKEGRGNGAGSAQLNPLPHRGRGQGEGAAHKTALSPFPLTQAEEAPRGVFYVYDPLMHRDRRPTIAPADWRAMLDAIRGTALDAFVLAQSTDASLLTTAGFDGLFTYDVYAMDGSEFAGIAGEVARRGGWFAPSVGPGYADGRVRDEARTAERSQGARYDAMWQGAIDSGAPWITITSFNEWHEGTQIEPAAPRATPDFTYLDYEGAYGLTGPAAERAYLDRTREWVQLVDGQRDSAPGTE